ncbi:MAG: amidohydrolase [Flavisolibacter sp.]|nr:amidohydrolase [Flavisolibacter sp.]
MRNVLCLGLLILSISVAAQRKRIDLLIYNAKIYTVDSKFLKATAIAIKDGKIVDVGRNGLREKYWPAQSMNAEGKFIYPGFIDAHAHFFGYAANLQNVDLVGTESWEDILSLLKNFAASHPEGWLLGRGWDQNDWPVKDFPTNEKLNALFPNRPVLLTRIDGHAVIANQKALEIAGIKVGEQVSGGEIQVKNGKLTGILVDNAVDLVSRNIPALTEDQIKKSLLEAQQNCFAVGLTTVDDCGLGFHAVELARQMQNSGELKMRMYIMLSDEKSNYDWAKKNGKLKTDRLNVRSFKVYADGALGSRGACLLEPYSDQPGHYGFLLSSQQHFDSVAQVIRNLGYQMCTHAIGDSGNRTILNTYAKYLKGNNDLRWRIEHAQVVDQNDFNLFGKYNVIPSVQPTHATSDMYWAGDRLGPQRVKSAYAYKQLLNENKWIPLGTDFPVEDISPFKTFHSAIFRTDSKEYPTGGYQPENALTREEALRGMTIWAAKANFEEKEKGSLEKGKFADFIILDKDIMTIDAKEILNTSVLATYINGEKVYQKK